MKVLLINGSPNVKGCTNQALQIVAKELEECEIETEIFHIGKSVPGCSVCLYCRNNGKCAFNDCVNVAIEKVKQCDGVVFGSPVYYASPNGSMVSFMDRLFFCGTEYFYNKPGACVVSARRAGTTSSLDVMEKYLHFARMPIVSSNYWNIVHGSTPKDVLEDHEGVQTMRILGKNLAWLLKNIDVGKKSGINPPNIEQKIMTNFVR